MIKYGFYRFIIRPIQFFYDFMRSNINIQIHVLSIRWKNQTRIGKKSLHQNNLKFVETRVQSHHFLENTTIVKKKEFTNAFVVEWICSILIQSLIQVQDGPVFGNPLEIT